MAVPTLADIDRIAALPDPVVRNLWITQCYAELSAAFAGRTGAAANWCTFATWASKQAGQTIRAEDLARLIERELDRMVASADAVAAAARALGAGRAAAEIRGIVRGVVDVDAVARRAADAVARGNLKVFDEIARVFAAHLTLPETEAAAALEALRAGEPPDGQSLLHDAFAHYGAALASSDDDERQEWLVLANLEIGLHEQVRLQPEIAESLNAAVPAAPALRDELFRRILPRAGALLRARLAFWRMLGRPAPLDAALERLAGEIRRAVRRVLTARVMTLELPGRVLRLGHDLGSPPGAAPRNVALVALLARIDPHPANARESGAIDWADLDDRMHYIAELFRGFHGAAELHEAPFTEAQLAELRAGRRPEGRL